MRIIKEDGLWGERCHYFSIQTSGLYYDAPEVIKIKDFNRDAIVEFINSVKNECEKSIFDNVDACFYCSYRGKAVAFPINYHLDTITYDTKYKDIKGRREICIFDGFRIRCGDASIAAELKAKAMDILQYYDKKDN